MIQVFALNSFVHIVRYFTPIWRSVKRKSNLGLCNKSDNEERCGSQVNGKNKNELNEIWKMNKRNKSGM